jgi:hypothetical protein
MDVRNGDGSVMSLIEPFTGIRLRQRERGAGLPAINSLYEAFTTIGVHVEVSYDLDRAIPEGMAEIRLGFKP